MNQFTLMIGAAALLAVGLGIGAARAESEGEMIRLHDACRTGDRAACDHFSGVIHSHHDHETEWRRSHAEWYR
jgi:hypothetical protein